MRITLCFSGLAALLLTACLGSRTSGTFQRVNEEEVRILEDKWMVAFVKKDTAVLAQVLAPEFTLSGSNQVKETRMQYLQTAAMKERTLQPLQLTDRDFQTYSSTIISTGRTVYMGKWQNNQFKLPVRYTNIYTKNKRGWQLAASHISIIQ